MKEKGKVFMQCGYETECRKKDCITCPRKRKYKFILSLAEEIAIEDFAMCDLKSWTEDNPEDVNLTQEVIKKLMHRMFNQQPD